MKPKIERRRFDRYETQARIFFRVKYDLRTKVSFKVIENHAEKEYEGITRNVSVEGLRFTSPKKLKKKDLLYLELYLPRQKKPICMTGEARWCRKFPAKTTRKFTYDTGVRLVTLGQKKIQDTIYFDEKYGVYWSIVLNTVFGSFKEIVRKMRGCKK